MRVNVYSEELTEPCEVVTTKSQNDEEFIGLRVWLDMPPGLAAHSTPEDNDRPAVTFWFAGYRGLFDFIEKVKRARLDYVRNRPADAARLPGEDDEGGGLTTITIDRLRELEACEKAFNDLREAMSALRPKA